MTIDSPRYVKSSYQSFVIIGEVTIIVNRIEILVEDRLCRWLNMLTAYLQIIC